MEAFYEAVDPLPFLLTLLVGLILGLATRRALAARGLGHVRARWAKRRRLGRAELLVVALSLLGSAPLWVGLDELIAPGAMLNGDAASHVRVAQEVASFGLPRGWIASYGGGFPFGPHYQSGVLLVAGGLIRLGLHPITATMGLGMLAILIVPALFAFGALRAGASRGPTLLGALFLAWMWPLYHWIGGPGVMIGQGLVSQAFATPLCVATGVAVLTGSPRRAAPILAALAVASHAQMTICAFAVTAPAILLFGSRPARRRYVFAGLAGAITAIAHYGPGAAMFALPFSWADVPLFSTLGWGVDRLPRWFVAGDLFDQGRAPLLSGLLWIATLASMFALRSRAAKGALVFLATTIAFSVAGVELFPVLGRGVFEIFSPVRTMCILPFAAATVVIVGVTELGAMVTATTGLGRLAWIGRHRVVERALIVAVALWVGLPHQRALARWADNHARARADACANQRFAGWNDPPIASALSEPLPGRVVVTHEASRATRTPCPVMRGGELAIRADLGAGTAGPGSQLGVTTAAFHAVRPETTGAHERAEALGIRRLLHPTGLAPKPDGQWVEAARSRDAVLSTRVGGTDAVGVGCVVEKWSGDDRALRDALFQDLRGAQPASLRPTQLVELSHAEGAADQAVKKRPVASGPCRAERASVSIETWSPGHVIGRIETETPVEAVLRATYVPTWSVEVDGKPMPYRLVAPGFLAFSVNPGVHRFEATVAPLPFYRLGLMIAALAVALLGWRVERR